MSVALLENRPDESITDDSEVFEYRQRIEQLARKLLSNREMVNTPEVGQQEYVDNARTALMEAMTASGHLSVIELTGTVDEINDQVLSRLLNGMSGEMHPHEYQRRFAELCNELYIQDIHGQIINGQISPDTTILEISDYPHSMSDSDATVAGYRRGKGMVRTTSLRENADGTFSRIIKQGSRASSGIATTGPFMAARGIRLDESKPTDIAVLEKPVVLYDPRDAAVEVMRQLDRLAGPGILYGDPPDRHHKHVPYEQLEAESHRREQEIGHYYEKIAAFEKQLDEQVQDKKITLADRNKLYAQQIEIALTAICAARPAYTEDTFGKAAVEHFAQASDMIAAGDVAGAQALLQANKHLRETVTFCGMAITVEEAQQQGLKVNSFGQLVEADRENWVWKKGRCRIDNCPNAQTTTDIGPCDVCRNCQKLFDQEKDPKKVYGPVKKLGRTATGIMNKAAETLKRGIDKFAKVD